MTGNKKIRNLIVTPTSCTPTGGFTMIELLTSVGLFMVVVVAASSLFIAVVQGNRKAIALQNILDEGKFVLEIMSRDIRTGKLFSVPTSNSLEFTNAEGNIVCYRYNVGNKSIQKISSSCGGSGSVNEVTSSHISVDNFKFTLTGESSSDNIQPRIVISMGITNKGTKAESQSSINLETTISSRLLQIN